MAAVQRAPDRAAGLASAIIYDGDCGFCTSCANWFQEQLPDGATTTVAPWQALDLDSLGLRPEEVSTAVYWVDANGQLHRGHEAVGHALGQLGRSARLAGAVLRHRPVSWLAAPAYRLIATNRHRLPGSTDSCRI